MKMAMIGAMITTVITLNLIPKIIRSVRHLTMMMELIVGMTQVIYQGSKTYLIRRNFIKISQGHLKNSFLLLRSHNFYVFLI